MKIALYIKTHNKTGLKYFGKATGKNLKYINKYTGSGLYWKRHLKEHGNDVSTEIYGEYDNIEECSKAAIAFSIKNDIANSDAWANLMIENGIDGAPVGHNGSYMCEKSRKIVSDKSKRMWRKNRNKIINAQKKSWTLKRKKEESDRKIKYWTTEKRREQSNKLKGRKGHTLCKGVPKHKGFGKLISKALTGKPKTPEHLRTLALSRQKDKRIFIDHLGERYELHSDFSEKYGVAMNTFRDLDAKITRCTPVYKKLGIDYNYAKNKTKRELGFRFE